MAASVEAMRIRQAEHFSPREGMVLPTPHKDSLPKGTILDTLNPLLDDRPPLAPKGTTFDISVLQPHMIEIYRMSGHTVEAVPRERTQETIVFSAEGGQQKKGKNRLRNEAGQNIYFNPVDDQIYSGDFYRGNSADVPDLFNDLRRTSYKHKYPLISGHSHHSDALTFPYHADSLIIYAKHLPDETRPLVNGMYIIGADTQVVMWRTDKSPGLLSDAQIQKRFVELQKEYKEAGGETRQRWREKLQTYSGERYVTEKLAYDAYIQEARDEFLCALLEGYNLQFARSHDMMTAKAMTPRDIIREQRAPKEFLLPAA